MSPPKAPRQTSVGIELASNEDGRVVVGLHAPRPQTPGCGLLLGAASLKPHTCAAEPGASSLSRVLVIGLDGATYDLLVPWTESGWMPNLAHFMRTAALAELSSTLPYITPVAWTSFLTGCQPAQHGVLDYRYLDHTDGRLQLNQFGQIACPTLFSSLAAAAGPVVSLNLPMTYPPPAGVPGIVVGGLDSPSMAAALSLYPRFAQRLRQRLGAAAARYDLPAIWRRKPRAADELSANAQRTQAAFRGQCLAAQVADELVDWRLMIVQFQELDALQHRCWHLLSPRAEARSDWLEPIRAMVGALDACLGELLELAARRDAAILVLSDHGFGDFRGKIVVPRLLESQRLLRRATLPQRAVYRISRGAWKAERWLWRRVGMRPSTAGLSRPLRAVIPIDWHRSLAFTAHGDLAAMVYLNDAARLGEGPIRNDAQRAAAERQIIAALLSARHEDTGESLFAKAFSVRHDWGLDPLDRRWPDVVGIPAPGYHTRSKIGPGRRTVIAEPELTGTHRQAGVLMVGNAALPNRFTAQMADVAPTILSLLGIAIPAHMTGHAMLEMVGRAQGGVGRQTASPTPALATARAAGVPREVPALSADGQAVIERRLRDLGYLD
jgi:predicted AlkP superfamily phosphohydrolase/phosphomutase